MLFNVSQRKFLFGGYSIEYNSVLNYAISQGYSLPSDSQKIKQDTFIQALKNCGSNGLSSFYLIRVYANDAPDGANLGFSGINWVNAGTFIPVPVNSPVKTSNIGYSSDGSTKYINNSFNPVSVGVGLNDNFIGGYIFGNASSGYLDGSRSSPNGFGWQPRDLGSGGKMRGGNGNFNYNTGNVIATSEGLTISERTAVNSTSLYRNGVLDLNNTIASVGFTNSNLTSLCRDGSINFAPSSLNLAFYVIGKASQVNQANLYTAVNNYLTSL